MKIRNTPLSKIHEKLGAKMVDFNGWNMPMSYTSIIDEHMAVRQKVGIFDVSHMGQIEVKGAHAMELLQWLTPNDLKLIKDGAAQYNAFLNEDGGITDDLIVYRVSQRRFLLCVNAANTDADLNWLADNALQYPDVDVQNVSRDYGMLSVQGPKSEALIRTLTQYPVNNLEYYHFDVVDIGDLKCLLARTGYTGEDGFEIFCDWTETPVLWESIMTKGRQFGIKPIGLGARDTLRIEMRYPLYGADINEDTTPIEAGLDWIVRLDKDVEVVGGDVLMKQQEEGVKRKLVGLQMIGRGIPRAGYEIFYENEKVGDVTSGTMSPTLKKAIGLGYVRSGLAKEGTRLMVEIRGKQIEAEVFLKPFVSSSVKKSAPPEIKETQPAS